MRHAAMNEVDYKPDLDLLDRYQQFSSELLRIALMGIALLGFFIEKVATASIFSATSRHVLLALTALTSASCLVSAGGALAHRYYSTDGVFFHIRSHRLRHPLDPDKPVVPDNMAVDPKNKPVKPKENYYTLDVAKDEGTRNSRYHESGRYLGLSVGAMILAAACAVAAITVAALSYAPEGSSGVPHERAP